MERGAHLPLVSVIIPHYGGEKILKECLHSLDNIDYPKLEIILVDNLSPDNSISFVQNKFPNVKVIKSDYNRGYAGGCNFGAQYATGKYLLIINNDTIHKKNSIRKLVEFIESSNNISSVQPKILNYNKQNYFDYAGGCGGFMDKYCIPFARGRVVNTIEPDEGQYDNSCKIFWASGTAFLTQKKIFEEVNGFDEILFAHMEEIDYHWKCQMQGYEIWVEPQSVIYHHGASTLPASSPQKTYLNYRNSLILFLTNYPFNISLKLIFPRLLIEFISLIKEFIVLRWGHAFAILKSWFWIISHINILYKRKQHLGINKLPINIYAHSIVIQYFLFQKKKYGEL